MTLGRFFLGSFFYGRFFLGSFFLGRFFLGSFFLGRFFLGSFFLTNPSSVKQTPIPYISSPLAESWWELVPELVHSTSCYEINT